MLELISLGIGESYAMVLGIVANQFTTIASTANVELEAVATVLQGQIERGKRVFRNISGGAGSAMAKKKRARGSHSGIVIHSETG